MNLSPCSWSFCLPKRFVHFVEKFCIGCWPKSKSVERKRTKWEIERKYPSASSIDESALNIDAEQRIREIDKCLVAVSRHMLCINYSKTNGVPLFVHRPAFFLVMVSFFVACVPLVCCGCSWCLEMRRKIKKCEIYRLNGKQKLARHSFLFVSTLAICALIIHITTIQLMCALIWLCST